MKPSLKVLLCVIFVLYFTSLVEPKPRATIKPTARRPTGPIPRATSKPIPRATPKLIPRATPKPIPKATPKPIPRATSKPIPRATPKPIPRALPKPLPRATREPIIVARIVTRKPVEKITPKPTLIVPIVKLTPKPALKPFQPKVETIVQPKPVLTPVTPKPNQPFGWKPSNPIVVVNHKPVSTRRFSSITNPMSKATTPKPVNIYPPGFVNPYDRKPDIEITKKPATAKPDNIYPPGFVNVFDTKPTKRATPELPYTPPKYKPFEPVTGRAELGCTFYSTFSARYSCPYRMIGFSDKGSWTSTLTGLELVEEHGSFVSDAATTWRPICMVIKYHAFTGSVLPQDLPVLKVSTVDQSTGLFFRQLYISYDVNRVSDQSVYVTLNEPGVNVHIEMNKIKYTSGTSIKEISTTDGKCFRDSVSNYRTGTTIRRSTVKVSSSGAIVGGVIAAVLLVAAIVAILVFVNRERLGLGSNNKIF